MANETRRFKQDTILVTDHFNNNLRQLEIASPMSGNASRFLFQHQVLGKYDADYYHDEKIGYILVRQPHWLDEAYAEAISSMDTGVLARNLANIEIMKRCLSENSHHGVHKGIDLGAGYGIFVRGMRDNGIDFHWSDKYAANLLARGFGGEPGERYGRANAFEVLEHLANPIEFLQDARREFRFHTCFFSALCFDEQKLPGTDWWYWSFESGQHISFFSQRALLWMAEQLDMRLWHIQGELFAVSELEWRPLKDKFRLRVWGRVCNKVERMLQPNKNSNESLTWSDLIKVRDKLRDDFKGCS